MRFPGFVRDTWFKAEKEGVYRGACVELCGKNHAFMPIVVEVEILPRNTANG
jgi:cytochrome c oxidase subunit 2